VWPATATAPRLASIGRNTIIVIDAVAKRFLSFFPILVFSTSHKIEGF